MGNFFLFTLHKPHSIPKYNSTTISARNSLSSKRKKAIMKLLIAILAIYLAITAAALPTMEDPNNAIVASTTASKIPVPQTTVSSLVPPHQVTMPPGLLSPSVQTLRHGDRANFEKHFAHREEEDIEDDHPYPVKRWLGNFNKFFARHAEEDDPHPVKRRLRPTPAFSMDPWCFTDRVECPNGGKPHWSPLCTNLNLPYMFEWSDERFGRYHFCPGLVEGFNGITPVLTTVNADD
ncbi:hypothetical protein BGW36DRAFT_435821 [Talaromyces proteolyticus]|uniref:Uncharacterized protein n=1 Tax=Talaromyces proteolyticus TaxID=1131652 RepID=A0AAD4L1G3_9EURO|nr:uncharacterized protein BGW36DRAFT_435821 [Talaromyces proteolyticus]KAH8705813.1 hypothetical protein BGW36DRAFT_435821 [Talaromyces proteolyticus]